MYFEKIKNVLWKDYEESIISQDELKNKNVEYYKVALDNTDKIRNELIKLEQIENDKIIQKEQLKSDKKKEMWKNGIAIATLFVSIGTVVQAFRFDRDSTMTSTLGRPMLTKMLPNFGKR